MTKKDRLENRPSALKGIYRKPPVYAVFDSAPSIFDDSRTALNRCDQQTDFSDRLSLRRVTLSHGFGDSEISAAVLMIIAPLSSFDIIH